MKAKNPYQLLSRWRKKHLITLIATLILLDLVVYVLWSVKLLNSSMAIASMIPLAILSIVIYRRAIPNIDDAISLSHQQNENIEYSARMLLNEEESLTGLAAIQRQKTIEAFRLKEYTLPFAKRMVQQLLLAGMSSLLFLTAIQALWSHTYNSNETANSIADPFQPNDLDQTLKSDTSYIESITSRISPPAYTGLSGSTTSSGDLSIVEGSSISWKLNMKGKDPISYFIVGNQPDTSFLPASHAINRSFREATYYRYGFKSASNAFVSDYYSIKVTPDEAPSIAIDGINEYEKLPWAKNHLIDFDIEINDEYGIDQAILTATVAKGSGESVKFREKTFPLRGFIKGNKTYQGSYQFSTKGLNMEPGSELYFHIKVKDNCPYEDQWTKSKTYFVAIQDTAEYEYVDDMGMQVDLMPDFFRSQRQIIIDTEKLIAEKANMSIDSFKRASNALGYDQKMLRLKYGQFLGEENESGIAINNEIEAEEDHDDHDHHDHEGHDHDEVLSGARDILSEFMHDHDHEEEGGLLMATKGTEDPTKPSWVEELSHNHDNMEEATFHDVSVKSKLKAALSEMWDAELHLRLYDPAASLPYQYESLKCLQEVKNHARIYVHRIGFDPPVIKEAEKRLSGEQDKVITPSQSLTIDREDDYAIIRDGIKQLGIKSSDVRHILNSISPSLAQIAIEQPNVLPVLSMIQRALSEDSTPEQIQMIRSLLIKILPDAIKEVKNDNIFSHNLTREVVKNLRS